MTQKVEKPAKAKSIQIFVGTELKAESNDRLEALEKLANDTRLYKWTKEQLIEIKEEYKWKLKELRKFNK